MVKDDDGRMLFSTCSGFAAYITTIGVVGHYYGGWAAFATVGVGLLVFLLVAELLWAVFTLIKRWSK